MRFQFQSVINAIQPSQNRNGIAGLVMDILVLEERLQAPEAQSEYFRWGIQAHRDHLEGLNNRYARIREEFNGHDISQFRVEIAAQESRISEYSKCPQRFIRYFVLGSAQSIIAEMTDRITIKGLTDQLPTIEELKEMPELLSAILET